MKTFAFADARVLLVRLDRGDDLLAALQALCEAEGVQAGTIEGIGAVEEAVLGWYDQAAGRYLEQRFGRGMEITALLGNVSLRDGVPFVHAHLTLADGEGRCFGGHLMPGTRVFACELCLRAFAGEAPVRQPDGPTGLMLW